MSQEISIHRKSVNLTYPESKTPKLPFLSSRVRPLDYVPPILHQNTLGENDKMTRKNVHKLNLSIPRHESVYEYSPSSMISMQIPTLKYSIFKKSMDLKDKNRRKSTFAAPPGMLLSNKYNIAPLPEIKTSENKQPVIKESIINKRAFKRIEPHEIEFPSKTLGQKLVRVQQLVIDPLLTEGDFSEII